jgi:hypothetical protein
MDFKYWLVGLGKDTAEAASLDRRTSSYISPPMPPPCKQEKTPWTSGPRTCAQLQPRRFGCRTHCPHDDGGLQITTPRTGDDQRAVLYDPSPLYRQRRGEIGGQGTTRDCQSREGLLDCLPPGTLTRATPGDRRPSGNQARTYCRGVDSATRSCRQPYIRAGARMAAPNLAQPETTRNPGAPTGPRGFRLA